MRCALLRYQIGRDRRSNRRFHAEAIKLRHLAPGSWQPGSTVGVCIRSHLSLTVCARWPCWPTEALLSTYALFTDDLLHDHCSTLHRFILTSYPVQPLATATALLTVKQSSALCLKACICHLCPLKFHCTLCSYNEGILTIIYVLSDLSCSVVSVSLCLCKETSRRCYTCVTSPQFWKFLPLVLRSHQA